jgi:hypothetical protein
VEESAETVELSRLGDDPQRYAALLGEGKRITVTDEDGRVLAYLVPPEGSHLVSADRESSPFERLVAAGQVRRATGNLLDHLDPEPALPGAEPLGDAFLRLREEERY